MRNSKPNPVSRQEEIVGILMMTLGLLIFLSLVTYNPNELPGEIRIGQIDNQLGIAGVYLAHYLVKSFIGRPSVVVPIIIILLGWTIFRSKPLLVALRWSVFLFLFALYTAVILGIPVVTAAELSDNGGALSGAVGTLLAERLVGYLGLAGAVLVLLALGMITVVSATNVSLSGFLTKVGESVGSGWGALKRSATQGSRRRVEKTREPRDSQSRFGWSEEPEASKEPPARRKPTAREPTRQLEIKLPEAAPTQPEEDLPEIATTEDAPQIGNYQFPPLDLLDSAETEKPQVSKEELFANAQILEDRLLEFGVQGKVTDIKPGPVITRYEFEPAPGVKISRIASLSDDLALAMRAKRIRIVAPIPGKAAVGIELPNRDREIVYLKDIIHSSEFRRSESPLTLALGKTISGEPYVARLDEMPHLLIAGATGSGKSVCLNTIIASILYKAHPTQVQLVMIDPKRLELSIYNHLRGHHLNYREDLNEEVVTSPANAISVLKSVERVMESRYEILARAGVRNIRDYNRKLQSGQLQAVDHDEPFEPLEYLVLIVDELADLMLIAAREVEEPIARLTQMSRAVGIHLIVATQRPSVDVITGVIKANFPARIAFQVASKTDSRTILDANGAEKLLGMGDMLFVPPGSPEPIRLHGTYVSTEEIERIIAHIRKQPKYPKKKLPVDKTEAFGGTDEVGGVSSDALFHEAARLVVRHQQGSISLLQRRLKVGYARAARLIDELEAAGVVGPFDGSKAREVLVADEQELEELGLV